MIELERHIEILLLDNDCVIVPGLGGFLTNHVEARYDSTDHLFLPPLRTLGFNPKLRVNDSLLAQSYIEAYDISYPEAMRRIEDEVNELCQRLRNEGEYELNDIGTLTMNDDERVEFSPCEAGLLTPSLYALDSFEIEPLARQRATNNSMVAAVQIPTSADTQAESASIEPIVDVADDESPEESGARVVALEPTATDGARTVSIRVSLLRNMAAAAIAVFAFLLFTTPLSTDQPSTAAIDSGMLRKIMPKEVVSGAEEVKRVAQAKPQESPAPAVQEQQVSNPRPNMGGSFYTLVLASHVTKANAAEYAQRLSDEGYDGVRVITKSSTKVICGSYPTEAKAYEALNKLRDQEPFREAWVLKVELNEG